MTLLLIGRESGLLVLHIGTDVSAGFKGMVSSPAETTELLLDLPMNEYSGTNQRRVDML